VGQHLLARHDVADDAPDSLSLGATYGVLRFKGAGLDSNTYGLQSRLNHVLTPRLTSTIGYGFTYLDVQGQENSTTHAPRWVSATV